MKRRHVLAIFILLVGGYILAWHLSPARELNYLVIDKTVPGTDYREHRAIFWVAEHRRFTDQEGRFLRADRDYLGYHPASGAEDTLNDEDLEGIELLYLADTYGIYDYEEGLDVYEERLPYQAQDIELLYGGFDSHEVNTINRFAGSSGNFLIGEHNIFGYPTYLDPQAALSLQDIFAVSYSGWLIRYYENLDEMAFWMKELYTRIYGIDWDLEGAGMVFVREDHAPSGWNTDLIIVQQEHFDSPWPVIINGEHELLDGANSGVPYLYWLEVLEVDQGAEVLAYYELPIKEEAREALRIRGLPERFPAAVYYNAGDGAERLYFAGDFADQLPALLPACMTGSASIQRFFSYIPGIPVQYRFYFQWYEPVLHNIFDSMNNQEQP